MNGKKWVLRRPKEKTAKESGTEHIDDSKTRKTGADSKAPTEKAAGTAEEETTIRNMLRDTFLPDIVFL